MGIIACDKLPFYSISKNIDIMCIIDIQFR